MKKFCICLTATLTLVVLSGVFSSASANAKTAASRFMLTLASFDYVEASNHFDYFKWTTVVEMDVQQMELQGSTDSNSFVTLQVIPATNTTFIHTYYSNMVSCDQYCYYRLVIVNENGIKEYSKVIHTKIGSTKMAISIFPNPVVNSSFNLKVPSTERIAVNIFTKDGKLLYSTTLEGQNQYWVAIPSSVGSKEYLAIQVISNGKTNAFNILSK